MISLIYFHSPGRLCKYASDFWSRWRLFKTPSLILHGIMHKPLFCPFHRLVKRGAAVKLLMEVFGFLLLALGFSDDDEGKANGKAWDMSISKWLMQFLHSYAERIWWREEDPNCINRLKWIVTLLDCEQMNYSTVLFLRLQGVSFSGFRAQGTSGTWYAPQESFLPRLSLHCECIWRKQAACLRGLPPRCVLPECWEMEDGR